MARVAVDACECDGRGVPPAFCEDDLYCPQCGHWVADLGSVKNLVEAEEAGAGSGSGSTGALWVYPDEGLEGQPAFRFTLTFQTRDPTRKLETRWLDLTSARCGGALRNWFEADLQPNRNESRAEEVDLVLQPRAGLREGWHDNLPEEGVRGTLELRGNCGRRLLTLRVFSDPIWHVEIEMGGGVVPDPGWDKSHKGSWKLSRTGPQDLVMRIAPTNAAVYLPAIDPDRFPVPSFRDGQVVKVKETPASGVVLRPDKPAVYVVEVDTTDWTEL